ncbi:histidine kinase [Opitutaceae bacterium]|nr:histidine kinase [Opitutaceae bacterium]MDB4473679.1 histidine kinase [Opitutaceae bacterium]
MRSPRWPTPLLILFGLIALPGLAQSPESLSLTELEERQQEIDDQLGHLANYNLSGGIGAIGFRSPPYPTKSQNEWIEIELRKAVPLDQVLLVPAIRRDGVMGFQADGFPREFRLVAGTGEDRTGTVVAEFHEDDSMLPRIAPLVIPCHGIVASWIRIEATTLSLRNFDSNYVLQLSEVLAFSGEENVALHRPIKFPDNRELSSAPGWPDSALVDGFLPYLMASSRGEKSVAYLCAPLASNHPALTIDLGADYPISRLHLHAVDQGDTVPQAYTGDIGIPRVLWVEGANEPDFRDARFLTELRHSTPYDIGPILMLAFPETHCRYVRLTVMEANFDPLYPQFPFRLGFAEIELFSDGENIALHKPITINFEPTDNIRPIVNLTDGRNYFGEILPIRQWLNQLAQRHELERELPLIVAELGQRYGRQTTRVAQLTGLAVILAFGVIVIMLANRNRQQHAVAETRKRIAADLHDELGADLHALGILSDLAFTAKSTPGKLDKLLRKIRSLTERTGKAARHCTNLLEVEDLHKDLVNDVRNTASRILTDLDRHVEIEGEEMLRRLSPRKHMDLLLFYQECLINVIRHSGATYVHTHLIAADGQITLTVTDNGRGLEGHIPSSLKRRARLFGADIKVRNADPIGSVIILNLKNRWLNILK